MSNADILRKLRNAHIPSYAITTNFERTNLATLRTRITQRELLDSANPTNIYIFNRTGTAADMRRVTVAVALAAKALCLHDKPIVHVNLAGFLREQRFNEMERTANSVNPVMSRIGKGYIAIGDFLEFADVQQKYGYHAVQLAADYLLEHIERGGGLIVGANNIPLVEATQFGAAFNAALVDNFEAHQI